MSSFRASVVPACATAIIAAVVVTACASSRLSSAAPRGVRLTGDWKLDPTRSDDLGRAVAVLHAQAAKAAHDRGGGQQEFGGNGGERREGGGENPPGPESGGQGIGVGPAPSSSPVDELMSSVPRGDYLRINVSATAFTVTSGDSSEQYTPGLESEISAEQGDAQQISGWKGADYVIDTKPQWGAEIITSYGLTQDGNLSMTVRLAGAGTKFTFTRIYDRTTRVAPLAPPTIN